MILWVWNYTIYQGSASKFSIGPKKNIHSQRPFPAPRSLISETPPHLRYLMKIISIGLKYLSSIHKVYIYIYKKIITGEFQRGLLEH